MAKKKISATLPQPEAAAQVITQEMIDKWNATDPSSITYTTEQFEQWVKDGKIPRELGDFALADMEKALKRIEEHKELTKNHPNPEAAILESVNKSMPSPEDMKKSMDLHKFILDNKESLLKIIQGAEKPRKFRQSAHYVEQKLHYEKPASKQICLFDKLSPLTVDKIKEDSVKHIGIKLSPPEDKLVNAITRLLAKKSQTIDYKAEDYYMGNQTTRLVPYGVTGQKEKSAVLRFKKSELLTEFYSNNRYSGDEIKYFDRIFASFKDKKWLIRYKRTVLEGKEQKHTIIEDYLPLVRILQIFDNLSTEEAAKVEGYNTEFRTHAVEYILSLHPIITDQIDSKYIEFPEDIDYRTKIAAESPLSVSEAIILLRDYLISEMSAGRYESEINEENLVYKLRLDKHIRSRKKDRLQEQLAKAIQVSQHLGIILDVEKTTGSMGQNKYIFKLNKDFE